MKAFQWHEPASYRRAIYYENERSDPGDSAKFAGSSFLIVLGLRFLAGLGSNAHPPAWPVSIGVAALIALFTAYGLPTLMSLLPGSIVIISDKGINNNKMTGRGWQIRFWPWEQIAYCTVSMDSVGGKTYEVISLCAEDGHVLVTLAFTDRSASEQLNDFLRANGKQPIQSA